MAAEGASIDIASDDVKVEEKNVQKPLKKRKSLMQSMGLGGLFGTNKEEVPEPEVVVEEPHDIKDTETFQYEMYETIPEFTEEHKSLMSKLLTPELFEQMKDLKTEKGYTLSNAIQTGVKTPHLGVGITAGDEESWTLFKDIMYPIIKGWHGFDPETENHQSDLDASKLEFSAEQALLFDKYVKSTRIRAARNVSGYALPAGTLAEDRAKVQELLCQTFEGFEGELKGKYYPLEGMGDEDKQMLLDDGFLFQIPKETNLLWHAGAARDWPKNRGIFHNEAKTALCWVNEEDHCRIISMENGGNVKNVFTRFSEISAALASSAEANDTKLMVSDKLGFLGTCPSNLGTGLRASVMIKLKKLNEDVIFFNSVCEKFNLQPRGSAGEHSAAEGGYFDVSNKQRIGFTEVELVQKMINGITYIIAIEEKLMDNVSKEDISAMLSNPEELLAKPVEEDVVPTPQAEGSCCTIV